MGSVVTGLIAAFIWLLGALAYRWVRRWRAFGKLEGDYSVTRKLFPISRRRKACQSPSMETS